ncbi:hypothetical protein TRVL_09917 [Trypanosoma vivax]|nr:hypothetical protein TRVL_09917 [Trypanosoma vivax]
MPVVPFTCLLPRRVMRCVRHLSEGGIFCAIVFLSAEQPPLIRVTRCSAVGCSMQRDISATSVHGLFRCYPAVFCLCELGVGWAVVKSSACCGACPRCSV